MTKNVQVNLLIDPSWKEELESIARIKSYNKKKMILYTDLIREMIATYLSISGSIKIEENNDG